MYRVYGIIIIHIQIAELTRTWAGKWKDIQTVIEVCTCLHVYW